MPETGILALSGIESLASVSAVHAIFATFGAARPTVPQELPANFGLESEAVIADKAE